MAFEANDHVLQGKFLFFQTLHLDLIWKIFLCELIDPCVERTMCRPELAEFAFYSHRFRYNRHHHVTFTTTPCIIRRSIPPSILLCQFDYTNKQFINKPLS